MAAPSFPLPLALLLIDNQKGLNHPTHWGPPPRSTPSFETNISRLLSTFRSLRDERTHPAPPLIIHIYHSSTSPESPLHPQAADPTGVQFFDFLTPDTSRGELVMSKNVNSAFIGTDLEAVIRKAGIKTLVVAGLTTDHCVSTSVRMAANLHVVDQVDAKGDVVEGSERGRVVLVGDATATWGKKGFDAETVHGVTLASLDGEFAEVLGAEEVVKMLSG